MTDTGRQLIDELETDAGLLTELVERTWRVLPDPFGTAMLVPIAGDGDPCPVDALPWPDLVDGFRARHGRPPRPGARALAAKRLTAPRPVGGASHGRARSAERRATTVSGESHG